MMECDPEETPFVFVEDEQSDSTSLRDGDPMWPALGGPLPPIATLLKPGYAGVSDSQDADPVSFLTLDLTTLAVNEDVSMVPYHQAVDPLAPAQGLCYAVLCPVGHQEDAGTVALVVADATAPVDAEAEAAVPVDDEAAAPVGAFEPKSAGRSRRQRSTTPKTSKRLILGRKCKTSSAVKVECDLSVKCDFCPSILKNKAAKVRHSRVHRGLLKECEVCGKGFGQRQNLTRHMKAIHMLDNNGQKLTEEELTSNKCDFLDCDYSNFRDDKLKSHMEGHSESSRICCTKTYNVRNPRPCMYFCFSWEKMSEHEQLKHSKMNVREE